jgi:hypothetical protein
VRSPGGCATQLESQKCGRLDRRIKLNWSTLKPDKVMLYRWACRGVGWGWGWGLECGGDDAGRGEYM